VPETELSPSCSAEVRMREAITGQSITERYLYCCATWSNMLTTRPQGLCRQRCGIHAYRQPGVLFWGMSLRPLSAFSLSCFPFGGLFMFVTRIWCSSFQEGFDVLNEKIFHTCEGKFVPVCTMKAYDGVEV
jgi:hypothetical protein